MLLAVAFLTGKKRPKRKMFKGNLTMARPKKDVPRKHDIKFRCTLIEKKTIQKKAKNSGLNTAEFCRKTALEQKISYKLTQEEIECYKLLAEFRHNFQLISNLIRQRTDFKEDVLRFVGELDEHLKKLI